MKKTLISHGLSSWESIALTNSFGSFLNLGYSYYSYEVPDKVTLRLFIGAITTALGKLLA